MPFLTPGKSSNAIDRNAVSPDRMRRNFQRITQGAVTRTLAIGGSIAFNASGQLMVMVDGVTIGLNALMQLAVLVITRINTNFFTAKGDLLTWDGTTQGSTILPVGTDTFVLTADSTATNGIKWAASTGSLTASNFVWGEIPSGTVNGSNNLFTLANTPTAGTVRVYVDGVRQQAGASFDYSIIGANITFNAGSVPQTGDTILCDYMKP